mmetsp:Transcript_13035/g.37739  ORF Transcript_13035/g.37739 Transcript_13035/m.37739 type:complete len:496 (+) Transcript_13035:3693-5180(+)
MNMALGSTSNSHHRPILEHFASDGARPYNEVVQVEETFLHVTPEHCNLRIVPRVLRCHLVARQELVGEAFVGIKVQKAIDRTELAAAGLEHFLADDSTQSGAHGGKNRLGTRCQLENDTLLLLGDVFGRHPLCQLQNSLAGGLVTRNGKFTAILSAELVKGLECVMEEQRPIELGEVRHGNVAWLCELLFVRIEVQGGRLLDLGDVALLHFVWSRGGSQLRGRDFEGVRAGDFHLVMRVGVQAMDALEARKGDLIPRFQAVSSLILQHLDDDAVIVFFIRDDRLDLRCGWRVPVLVRADERLSEVAKNGAENASRHRVDEANMVLTALGIDGDQEVGGEGDGNHDAGNSGSIDQRKEFVCGQRSDFGNGDVDVRVQLGKGAATVCCARLADPRKVEVATEIVGSGLFRVAQHEGMDSGKDAVLCDFNPKPADTNHQGLGRHHAPLGLVAHHIELARVQLLVHFRGCADFHGGRICHDLCSLLLAMVCDCCDAAAC